MSKVFDFIKETGIFYLATTDGDQPKIRPLGAVIEADGKVIFGVTVELINLADDNEVRYRIVGEDEANIKGGKISVTSPIARALIGKEEGDVVLVRTPGGEVEYEIASVEHLGEPG